MNGDYLYDLALQAATNLFSNTDVSRATTRALLEELLSEIEDMVVTLDEEEDEE